MVEEIAFENDRISNFERLVTLTLDRVLLYTVVHHSSTSTYTPNFTEIEELFVDGWTYVRTHGRTDGRAFETGFIRSTLSKSRPNNDRWSKNYGKKPRPRGADFSRGTI